MSEPGLVSIIILNWNGARYLPDCIESIRNQSYNPIEIIAVDNGSTDDSVRFLRNDFSEIRLITNDRNLGFAEGMNTGIAFSRGEFVLLLNEDCYLDPDFIVNGIQEFGVDPSLAWVGGLVYAWTDGNRTNTVINAAFALRRRFQLTTLPDVTSRQEALMASTCAILLRRTALDDIRLGTNNWLDRSYFAYWEDTDLALRLWLRGWKCLYNPDLRVWHVVSGSVGGKKRLVDKPMALQRVALRNRYRTMIKNIPRAALLSLLPGLLVSELMILPYFALISPRTIICSIGAIWDVINSLPEILERRRSIQNGSVLSSQYFLRFFQGF